MFNTGLNSIYFGSALTSITENMFYRCTSLTNVVIPNSVITLGNGAFAECTGIISLTIGNSVNSMGWGVFNYCINLTTITCLKPTPLLIDATIFNYVNQSACCLIVPQNSVSLYQAAPIWQDFLFANCGALSSENFAKKEEVSVYPNPFQNELNIDLNNLSNPKLEVIDIHGKLLFDQSFMNGLNSFNTSDLSEGMYFIKITSDEGMFTYKTFKN
jgi:hypothetical protein